MNTKSQQKNADFGFSKPAKYEIKVLGEITELMASRLGGLSISVSRSSGEKAVSELKGTVKDQASLAGILNTLYDWHLPVISVKKISDK